MKLKLSRLAVCLLALPLLGVASVRADVPSMFRGDPRHSGAYPTRGPQQLKGVLWKFASGSPVRSTPAFADGRLYFGNREGFFYALDAATGREEWRFKSGGPVASSPAVYKGTVFFSSVDGYLYALNTADGSLKWKLRLADEKAERIDFDFWEIGRASCRERV